jgi:hypothetical protein
MRKVGARRAVKPRQVWAIRFFLARHRRMRDRALFDLAIDSKSHGCDVENSGIGDVALGGQIRTRAIVIQAETSMPVQFELPQDARASTPVGYRGGGRRGSAQASACGRSRANG